MGRASALPFFMKRLLDLNPLTGEAVWFEDNPDGTFDIHHEQDVSQILEMNKLQANDTEFTRKGIKEDWWKYASIPNVLIMKWSKEVGGDILSHQYEKELFKRLNDPEYKYLRTTHGKHTAKGR